MYALEPKYTDDAIPITRPIRTVWLSSQEGHHRARPAAGEGRRGANATIATAVTSTTTDHIAIAQRQSPCAAGSTPTGAVNTVGSVSPISTPLLKAAVARAIRVGNHSRTSAGNAGWLTATPTPIRNVAPKSTNTLGPNPRTAPNSAIVPSPITSAMRRPSRAMSSEPGTAAEASSSTGSDTSAPTAFSSRCRAWWMLGMSGGTESRVSRRSIPPSQRSSRRTQSARVSFTRCASY